MHPDMYAPAGQLGPGDPAASAAILRAAGMNCSQWLAYSRIKRLDTAAAVAGFSGFGGLSQSAARIISRNVGAIDQYCIAQEIERVRQAQSRLPPPTRVQQLLRAPGGQTSINVDGERGVFSSTQDVTVNGKTVALGFGAGLLIGALGGYILGK